MNEKMVAYFKVLADENRMKIVELLLGGERCGCTLIDKLNIQQPTLSYHLRLLTEAGITRSYREKNRIKYQVNESVIEEIKNYMHYLLTVSPSCHL